jgi:hypothetical protein
VFLWFKSLEERSAPAFIKRPAIYLNPLLTASIKGVKPSEVVPTFTSKFY